MRIAPVSLVKRSHVTAAPRILQAAEDCFGEHGIDAVSLRQIAIAAGQGNTAAVQYHFGSKEGLLEAIFQHRLPAIDQRRKALIETLDPQQRTQVRSLLKIIRSEEHTSELPSLMRTSYAVFRLKKKKKINR